MIGDIYLFLKKFFKQMFCIHSYKIVNASYRTFGMCSDFQECSKCKKINNITF